MYENSPNFKPEVAPSETGWQFLSWEPVLQPLEIPVQPQICL